MSATQTHIGYVRDENQDRVEIRQFGENLLLVVCDGMGGERSGSKASTMATDVFFEHFEEGYTDDMDAYSVRSLLLSSVSAANSVVYTTARMDYQNFGMGTTCVAAFVSDSYIAVANVGDSRAYLLTDETMEQITVDHTVVHMLMEKGEITKAEMETHPQRHMLMKAVGVERTVCPDFFRIDLEENQPFRLLLCSDGLSGFCSDAEIQAILSEELPAEEITQKLVDAALEKGGRDNISVAIVTAS
ncbi:Stp1/IreP family PP2C-type Ser/Thr phosphatase [uncultured Ruminococcus sp.]|uniref:Stp1/IreP family PP2C-type Ser/Thr phosphatase n=1 Tax=uncultured Ruminococcus sp. TaxID=165186 RepID=UPI0026089A4D|nr:Stp1/IreP family PP2C-type Ser/Thr phosphatase [uncultured Ruminococcus sp.]